MTGRNSGSRSMGETTQITATRRATLARRGTAGCFRSVLAVITQEGRNSATWRSSPLGSRRARRTINRQLIAHSPSATRATPRRVDTAKFYLRQVWMRFAAGAARPVKGCPGALRRHTRLEPIVEVAHAGDRAGRADDELPGHPGTGSEGCTGDVDGPAVGEAFCGGRQRDARITPIDGVCGLAPSS